ncbi:arginine--tRNA ligase [Paenibacillus mucilaginosus]|uniref:Arginine--tRNA ligase n=2 Tax=Paenibacillus mucilaginosus TaxID=61624 RepID=H6NA38_9BACL|nr:arginine--tRNA ligase [Paenibacillus mucilaginosus]AEI40237.1 ArgS [Paenibacillus mucilaginosus KNP414]AFC28882.1 ArgS [Paenibacillus mucilaginosus 3016]MCG7213393.1 arginine--tRNA ligase [Paenibacillus mucilaginosus]WDM29459.1 arginine--tRNA ligase [Paenibacillus mucilaginosus]WFA17638.1 arginine--tRNA ligase [Paenibacillus mucilaginosus]
MNYKQWLAQQLAGKFEGLDRETLADLIEYPPNPQMGDLSLPCFKLAKQLRKAPQAIAEELKAGWTGDESVERVDAVAGYFNVYLNPAKFAAQVVGEVREKGDRYGSQNIGQGRNIVIDFSSPNIAKTFHIGHLRSTVIGNALYKIFEFLGYNSVGINHLGDWGTQFGKLIVAYKLWGDKDAVEADGIAELQRIYVKFHDEADKNPALDDEARAWFVKLEQGDAEATELWRWFVDISLKEFHKMYDLLGVTFDSYAGESFYNDKMAAVVEELKAKNLLEEDQGALLVRLDDYNMPPALMIKKDGGTLYHTRDVTAAIYRKNTYDFDKAIIVTDAGQSLHFNQWFKVVELMGYEWAKQLQHVPFGKVSLENAKLSTRKGNVINLEDLLTKAIEKTRSIIEEKNPSMENKDEVARQIGVGAIIFNDLSNNRIKDIVFSWDDALNFEGESGPYVQYAHARACRVLGKADPAEVTAAASLNPEHLTNPEAQAVLRQLYLFKERVEQAMHKLEPSIVSRYLIDLAQSFNHFYHQCKIVTADEAEVRIARLALTDCFRTTIRNGLALIGLEAPEEV